LPRLVSERRCLRSARRLLGSPDDLQTHTKTVTLRIIWHRILRSIWHNGEPSEQRDSDFASFQDGARDPRPCTANQNARVLKTRHKAVISRISFQERFLRSVSSSSSGSACAREWTLEIGRFREWNIFSRPERFSADRARCISIFIETL
jgi:hypothetical protein